MKLQAIVPAVALLAAGAANAAIDNFQAGSTAALGGNSSAMLVMLDSTGTANYGLAIDLGYTFNDFVGSGMLNSAGQSVIWNLAADTVTRNGVTQFAGQNAWSAERTEFFNAVQSTEVRWAVLAGSTLSDNTPSSYLATGTPTSTNLTQQNSSVTGGMIATQNLFNNNATKGTFGSAGNGASAMDSNDAGYVGSATNYGPTTANGWQTQLRWSSWKALGVQTNFYQVNANGTEARIGNTATFAGGIPAYDTAGLLNNIGTFKLSADGTTLTWDTADAVAVVPEPATYGLALAGLLVAVAARRRRAA